MLDKLFFYADHTSQTPANSGVQRVVRRLGNTLQTLVREVVFVRWCPELRAIVRLTENQLNHLAQWDGPVAFEGTAGDSALHLDPQDKLDLSDHWLIIPEVTHLTAHPKAPTEDILIYARQHHMRTAAFVYDAIPLKREEYASIRETHSHYLQQLSLADCLITISESVADDITHFYKNTASAAHFHFPRIRAALLPHELLGTARHAFPEPTSDTINILTVGTVEPRKNQIALIKAFAGFHQRHPAIKCELHIVGNVHPYCADEINRLKEVMQDIHILNFVPDDKMMALYRQAHFTVFPSVEEGYGLPIAESLWLGVPCLCANFGSMQEIASGGGTLCVDTRNDAALYHALEQLILDSALREKLRLEAATRPLATWTEYSKNLLDQLNVLPGLSRAVYWVDSTINYHGNSGIQRVARQVAASLEASQVELLYVAWNRETNNFRDITPEEKTHLSLWHGPTQFPPLTLSMELQDAWLIIPEILLPDPNAQQVILAARKRGMKIALIFYDLIPVTLTKLYPLDAQAGYHLFFKMIAEVDLLIPISKTVATDLWAYYCQKLDRLATLKKRIHPIRLPGELRNFSRAQTIKEHAGPHIKILMVGTIEPRKNHLIAIQGFQYAQQLLRNKKSSIQLWLTIAGSIKDHAHYAEDVLKKIEHNPYITSIDLPTDEALSALYSECDFTLFPSQLEGFGLPILESLWHGRPCICSNTNQEIAAAGGCVLIDAYDADQLGVVIATLAEDHSYRILLAQQAINRSLKSWLEYNHDLTWLIRNHQPTFPLPLEKYFPVWRDAKPARGNSPMLSVCISTYNRAEWLRHSLRQVIESAALRPNKVEILVVDNASTDHTFDVMQTFQDQPNLRYHRNIKNVGMLGNLAVTSQLAAGDYVWILGDDDLIRTGAVARILDAITNHPRSEMIYLNYAYTHFDKPEELEHTEEIFSKATPVPALSSQNHFCEEIRQIAGYNENLFTAIYACVFRRDHAIAAYNQDTSGTPFSSLLTCIPTSVYVLNHLANRPGYWIADPYIIVNMNVSWRRWALIWHLERMPDLFDLAEKQGVSKNALEKYRLTHCTDAANKVRDIYFGQDGALLPLFSMARLLERCKHIPEFKKWIPELYNIYNVAYIQGRVLADTLSPRQLFSFFNLIEIDT